MAQRVRADEALGKRPLPIEMGAVAQHGERNANELGRQDADGSIVGESVLVHLFVHEGMPFGGVLGPIAGDEPHDAATIFGAALGQVGDAGRLVGGDGHTRVEPEPSDGAIHRAKPGWPAQLAEVAADDDGAEVRNLVQIVLVTVEKRIPSLSSASEPDVRLSYSSGSLPHEPLSSALYWDALTSTELDTCAFGVGRMSGLQSASVA